MFARKQKTSLILFLGALLCTSLAQAQKKAAQPAPTKAPPAATQQPSGPTPPQQPSGDRLNVDDLEQKYWQAQDTDFNVVQNRLYPKADRLALTLNAGMYVGEQWSEGNTFGADLSYFFSERNGISLAYSQTDSKNNQATTQLAGNQGGFPNHGKMKNFYGVAYNWVPFYAKMSVLNSSITYFDMSFSPGLGLVEYEQQREEGGSKKSAPALTLDITQHYFINRYLAIRVDYKNRWFQEEVVSYRMNNRQTTNDLNRTDLLMLGVTLYW